MIFQKFLKLPQFKQVLSVEMLTRDFQAMFNFLLQSNQVFQGVCDYLSVIVGCHTQQMVQYLNNVLQVIEVF